MTLTPHDADRIRTVHLNLANCVTDSAITAHMGATAQAWAPLSDEFAKALGDVTAIHRRRLAGEIDDSTAEAAVEHIVMAETGAMTDLFA